jgi:hypothetical protein
VIHRLTTERSLYVVAFVAKSVYFYIEKICLGTEVPIAVVRNLQGSNAWSSVVHWILTQLILNSEDGGDTFL